LGDSYLVSLGGAAAALSVWCDEGRLERQDLRLDLYQRAQLRGMLNHGAMLPFAGPSGAGGQVPLPSRPGKAAGKKPLPPTAPAKDKETLAAEKLKAAEAVAAQGNLALARVRCRQLIEDYPGTKAEQAARKLLVELGD